MSALDDPEVGGKTPARASAQPDMLSGLIDLVFKSVENRQIQTGCRINFVHFSEKVGPVAISTDFSSQTILRDEQPCMD